ncbi:MAG: hypothetical protein ACREBG_29110, partial [Pyrinomonadaceae bacterium]
MTVVIYNEASVIPDLHVITIDLQQISIATLIIALGLLVDVPVVAGDAIKNQLGAGLPPLTAAWVGPT